jgi:FdhD protein
MTEFQLKTSVTPDGILTHLENMSSYSDHPVHLWDKHSCKDLSHHLIEEEPLAIRVQGNPYSVVMRTPGDEIPLAAGLCLSEGIADSYADIQNLAFCDGSDSNVVTVTLNPQRRQKISHILDRRGFISQSSCGICGKELVKDLMQDIRPLTNGHVFDINRIYQLLSQLNTLQPLRHITRSTHAALIFSTELELLSRAEDVGRHNALDKAIGKLFISRTLEQAGIVVLSSRVSYELVQKASRARIPLIISVSRPTALAVRLAKQLNMTLACNAKGSGLMIYAGQQRLMGLKT